MSLLLCVAGYRGRACLFLVLVLSVPIFKKHAMCLILSYETASQHHYVMVGVIFLSCCAMHGLVSQGKQGTIIHVDDGRTAIHTKGRRYLFLSLGKPLILVFHNCAASCVERAATPAHCIMESHNVLVPTARLMTISQYNTAYTTSAQRQSKIEYQR